MHTKRMHTNLLGMQNGVREREGRGRGGEEG